VRRLTLGDAGVVNLFALGDVPNLALLVALVQRAITVVDRVTQVRDFFALGRAFGAAIALRLAALRSRTARTCGVIVVVTAAGEGEK
jgi:hypothetical protein